MPENKDLKRLVRARMAKTGESYTTARAHIVGAFRRRPKAQWPTIAGVKDASVKEKTGRSWAQWVAELDRHQAHALSHRDIAKHVGSYDGVSGWWAQTITVGYERIAGLRDIGQQRGGGYDANKSKTFPVHVDQLYRAVRDARRRRRWLGEVELDVRHSKPSHSIRATWPDGTDLIVGFSDKGPEKSTVHIQHRKHATKEDAEARKAFWAERFQALGEAL